MAKTSVETGGGKGERSFAEGKKKMRRKKQKRVKKTGVVYIKHIPHGFYEDEMKGFFSQFGRVLRVAVARSSKTGNSRGYGYVQFMDPDVAKIAAETMNNYLMFEKIVQCRVLPPELVTLATFANASRRPGQRCPGQRAAQRAVQELNNAAGGRVQRLRAQRRREAAQRRTVARLAELGVGYDLVGGTVQEVKSAPAPPSSPPSPPPAVLSVDPEDSEVTFRTPPNTVRRQLVRSESSPAESPTVSPAVKGVKTGPKALQAAAKTAKTAAKPPNKAAKALKVAAKAPKLAAKSANKLAHRASIPAVKATRKRPVRK